jgi:oxalate---CoA ligase
LQASEVMALPNQDIGADQTTIGQAIRRRAELQPDHAAVVATGFAPLSYRELQCLIDEVHAALRAAGFDRRARIAIAIPNGPQAALAIVAVACSAVSVPLNPRQTRREVDICLAALRPNAVLLVKGEDCAARQAAEEIGLTIIETTQSNEGALGFSVGELKTRIAATPNGSDEPDADAPAFILQTSGTTSEPKLIPFSHSNMLAAAARLQSWFNLAPQDRCLSVSPVFYSHGLKVTIFTPLLTGGTAAFPKDTSKFDYTEWFGDLKPTWYSAGPTLHRLVLDQTQSRADAKAGHSLRFILSGGAPLPRNVLDGLQRTLNVPVVEHYGSSEAAQIAANLPPPGRSKLGTCGIPWPGIVRIVGDDGRQLPPGEQGEVLVGGPTLISGYLNAPELNNSSFVNGWYKSGDIGSVDEEGFLTLHGRKNDLINRGGEKISPVEIDDALMRHPAVAEAAAFSVPHSRLGEEVAAAVVLRAGETVTSVELRRYLQDQLAPFKIPRRIVFRNQLPKGRSGKVQRWRLTESWQETATADPQIAAPQLVANAPVENAMANELRAVWERLLKTAPLSFDDDFFDMGGDSLIAAEMLVELETLTSQKIPSSILFEATTIRQLAQKLSELDKLRPKHLVQMHPDGNQQPLIYFHGNYHRFGHSALMLAKLLGSNQPLFIIAPHGTDDDPIPGSVEAMASDRLQLILNAQPEGPYRLGGKCLGGIIAFEVARQLVAAGKEVEMVVMLDPPTINARRSVQFIFSILKRTRPIFGSITERALGWTWFRCVQLQRFWNYPWTKRSAAIQRRWTLMKADIKNRGDGRNDKALTAPNVVNRSSEPTAEEWQFTDARTAKYATAMASYVPKPLAVRVIYVKVEFNVGAWERISPTIEVVNSPGTHEAPDLTNVAEHLKIRLQPSK